VRIGIDSNWANIAAGGAIYYYISNSILYTVIAQHSLAIKSDGSLWAWGSNGFGQLGNGTTTDSYVPMRVGAENNWSRIAPSEEDSLAIDHDSSIWTWGQTDDQPSTNDQK